MMTDCCATQCPDKAQAVKFACPLCGQKGQKVSLKTMLHHIKQPWLHTLTDTQHYYCRNPDCEVVYFSEDTKVMFQPDIRTKIGIKAQSGDSIICYCFGVSKSEAATNKAVKDFVIRQTKASMCSCDTANPSGRCCLKDFPAFKG